MKKPILIIISALLICTIVNAQYRINKTTYDYHDYRHQAGDRGNQSRHGNLSRGSAREFAPDAGELQHGGGQHEGVPDRPVIGDTLEHIEQDADGIDDAARHQQPEIHRRQRRRQRLDHRHHQPAHQQVKHETGDLEAAGEQHLHHHAEGRRRPDDRQDDVAGGAAEPVDRKRRVGRSDHDEDRRVIEAAQNRLRRTVRRHQIVGRRKAGHRQEADAIDRDADQHRKSGDMPQQPQAGVDREDDTGHMDDGISQPFVLRIKPGDAFDGAVHRVFDGLVHVFDGLVHGVIIATECGVTMNTARQGCILLRVADCAPRWQ